MFKIENNTKIGTVILENDQKLSEIISQTHIIKGEKIFCFKSLIKENIQNKSINNISTSFKTVLIKGISSEITKKDIINYFQKFGEIESVIINSNNQNIDLKGIIFNIILY